MRAAHGLRHDVMLMYRSRKLSTHRRPEKFFTMLFSPRRKHHGEEFLWTPMCASCVHDVCNYMMCTSCVITSCVIHHVYIMCASCVIDCTMCTSCVYHVYIMCISCVHHVYIMCTSCVHQVYIMCTSCVFHVYFMCTSGAHECIMCASCVHDACNDHVRASNQFLSKSSTTNKSSNLRK